MALDRIQWQAPPRQPDHFPTFLAYGAIGGFHRANSLHID